MLKRLLTLGFALITSVCLASELNLRGYDEYQIPAGYFIPIMSLQEFSTAYTEEGEVLDDTINYAFDGGLNGRKVIDLFLNEVGNYLNDGGIVQMIQSSLSGNEETLDKLDELGFIAEIAEKEHFFFEDITLINAYKI